MARNTESEKTLEARLVAEIKKRNGIAVKLTSQFHRGMPDRLILLPYHTIAFVEMKSTGQKPTALQEAAMQELKTMRFAVRVIDSTESLDAFIRSLDERLEEQAAETQIYLQRRNQAVKELKRDLRSSRKKEETR